MACSHCHHAGHVAARHEERCCVCGRLNVIREDVADVCADWICADRKGHKMIQRGFGSQALIDRSHRRVDS